MNGRPILPLILAAALLPLGQVAPSAAQELATGALTVSGDSTAEFVEDRGHVTVLELSGNYDRNLPGGGSNFEPRAVLAREFYAHHLDSYDFLVAFTTFPVVLEEARGLHWGVRNDVQGIGLPQFDNSDLFGSGGRLQGFIDMGRLAGHASDPFDPKFEETLAILSHEILHQWAAHVRFHKPDGSLSEALLGRDNSHWSFLLDSDASVLYGNEWRDNGDGTFTTDGERKFYSPLDLYLAGFVAPEEVPPFLLIESPGIDKTRLPERGVTVTGTPLLVTIEDVIAAEGPRVPASAEAQKELRAGFLLVTRPGETVTPAQIEALDRIRRALTTRFAVLTGGRGILHVFPEAVPGEEPGGPDPVGGGELRPGQADLLDALAWLRSRQGADGSWLDTAGTQPRDSAVVLATLTAFDSAFGPADRARAVAFLAAQTPPNTDAVARLATTLEAVAESDPAVAAQARTAAGTFRTRLRERQNADGGWGLGAGYGSDPLDTALAVLALSGRQGTPATVLDKAGQYLLATRGTGGGWSNVAGGASRTGATVAALRALKALDRHTAVAGDAMTFLAGRQNADGGFGDSPSTAHDTANVLQTAVDMSLTDRIDMTSALGYLTSRQTVSGSWEGSAYTTATVVAALRHQGSFANWRFSAPPAASPARPRDGERVALTLTVGNDGQAITPAGVLRLYDGDPSSGGTAAGDLQLPPIPPGRTVVVSATWDSFGKAGDHTLWAVLDPDGATAETSELDNRTSILVEVQPAPAGAELEVRGVDIAILPERPATLPVQLGIAVSVRNLGQTAAAEVAVQLWRGPPATGELVGQTTIPVPGRSSNTANFLYDLTTAGTTTFTVVVDPAGAVPEADETNNSATASVTTQAAVDLAVTGADLRLTGSAYLGTDATFEATFHNRGTVDAPDAVVRFSVTQGATVRELGTRTLQLDAGESFTQTITWRVDLEGELLFVAEVDPGSLVPESDEANNSATLPFVSGQISEPNLVISHQDMAFSPDPGREGRPLTVSALVRNTGGEAVSNAEVAFYEGNPAQGASRISEVQVIPELAAGGSATVSVTLSRFPDANNRVVHVVADPDHEVAEFSEDDNVAFEVLEVLSLPDAALTAASLRLEPGVPAAGQPVTLFVTVANLGEQEIENLVVRAFDGGAPVGGDQVIALVAGHGSGQASFTWTFGAGSAARSIVATADPGGAVEEQSEGNNSAQVEVSAQDGDFFVTNRYFSPNGDGAKDTTRLFFRLGAAATVTVEVVDDRGQVVRRHQGADLAGVANGSFEWDGRDGQGRVARDGDYELRVVGTGGAKLGAAFAFLDTDRWPLFRALGTPFVSFPNLTCDVPDMDSEVVSSDDDQWLFFEQFSSEPGYPEGIYRMNEVGGDLRQVLPPSTDDFTVSPDGSQVAYTQFNGSPELWIANADGSHQHLLWDGGSNLLAFSADGQSVFSVNDDGQVFRIPVNGSAPQLLLEDFDLDYFNSRFSPDRRTLVYPLYTGVYRILDLQSGQVAELGTYEEVSPENKFAFSPDGARVALLQPERGVVRITDSAGNLLRDIPIPIQSITTVDEYARYELEPGEPRVIVIGMPAWDDSGTELALKVIYGEGPNTFGRILRFDVATGEAETVTWLSPLISPEFALSATALSEETGGLPPISFTDARDVVWAPFERTLIYDVAVNMAVAIFLDEENRIEPVSTGSFADTWEGLQYYRPTFSPTGRRMFFRSRRDAENPQSPCFDRGFEDTFAFDSLLNLTASLRPRRSSTQGGIILEGSAADLHFVRYSLEYATTAAPTSWQPIAPPSSTPVLDGRFGTWVPPAPGSYLVRLTVEDLAGNVRSRVKRVSWSDTPALTDLYTEPAYISPNGDGVQDRMVLHYRVLEPVHLEIAIYDADGDRVRTLQRDHSLVGAEFEVTWDGRDDRGLPVPDGEYRITIQSYEFFVTVDTKPPAVSALLSIRGACEPPTGPASRAVVESRLAYGAKDANFAAGTIEIGEGAAPARWSPFQTLLKQEGVVGLEIDDFVNHRFRVEARDKAGNHAQATTLLGAEDLFLQGFGPHRLDATGGPAPLADFCRGSFNFERRPMRLEFTESVRAATVALAIQFQPVPLVNGQPNVGALSPTGWTESPVQALGVPNGHIEVLWNLDGVLSGVLTAARVRLVDAGGSSFLSKVFTFTVEGVDLRGLLTRKDLQEMQDESVAEALSSLLDQTGLDPDRTFVLWGRELVSDPLERLWIVADSPTDPRYAVPREIPVLATAPNGVFIANPADWVPCTRYFAKAVARTVPRATPDPVTGLLQRTYESGRLGFEIPCIGVDLEWNRIPVGACNTPRVSTRRTLKLTTRSFDNRPLQILTLSGPDETGHFGVLMSVNQPQNGTTYEHAFELLDRPEGTVELEARLVDVDGHQKTLRTTLAVDHTPPSLAIAYPLEGQRVCGVPRDGLNVVDVLARVEDAGGFATRLDALRAEDGQLLAPLAPKPSTGVLLVRDGFATEVFAGSTTENTRFTRTFEPLTGTLANATGEVTAHLEAVDNGGFYRCADTTFFFDAMVEGAGGSVDLKVFSPNGDGNLDEVMASFRADEPSTVDVEVFPAVPDPDHPQACLIDGNRGRNLVSGQTLLEGGTAVWDGRTDGGSRAPDGLYMLRVTLRDACGNTGEVKSLCTTVDTTPPQLAIAYPRPGDPLPMVIEVQGSVSDPHLDTWFVDFGEGPDPETWGSLATGDHSQGTGFLALWNTFGLAGEYTLRLRAGDEAANQTETRVQIFLDSPSDLITYLESGPRPFSPNGDGRREEAAVRFGLANPARVDLLVLDAGGTVHRRILDDVSLPAGAVVRSWDGRTGGGGEAPDGLWRLQLVARLASNPLVTQREEVTVLLDRTPPVVSLARPSTPFVSGSGPITGSVRDANLAEFTLFRTETPQTPNWIEILHDTFERTDATLGTLLGLEEGDHALRLVAVDQGEIVSEIVVPFTVDNTPPVVSLTAPAEGAVLGAAGGPVAVLGQATEEHLAAWRLERGAGAAPTTWTVLAEGTALPLPLPVHAWNLTGLADGLYTLRLVAEDKAGLRGEARVKVTVDNTPPDVALTAPAEDGYVTGPAVVTGTAADAHLLDYRLAVAAGSSTAFSDLGGGASSVTNGELFQWLALPPDGPVVLRLQATDTAGNQSEVRVRVTVDLHPPAAPQLTAKLENQRDARLTWTANTEPDLAGYFIYRDGTKLNTQPRPSPGYVDPGLNEGSYVYTVRAVDRAGQESEPSNPATVQVDVTAPEALLQRPAAGSRVSGLVDVTGTAWSATDFKEYRLYVGAGTGASPQLLRRSPVPVRGDVLAQWDTSALPEGSVHTLRLEAEDLAGNVAVQQAQVTVDNLPPAAPTGLAATASGTTANATWNANIEPDLRGYLLYRDGRLANSGGAPVFELDPFVLAATAYADTSLPDGTFTYEVYAIDQAGNLSAPSAPAQVTLDNRAPSARIAQPADGAEVEGTVYVLATTPDTDVARVLFQWKRPADAAWTDISAADTAAPWETSWNTEGLAYGDCQIRAVATDQGNRTDPAPVPVTVTLTDLTRPSAIVDLTARADGGDVHLTWPAVDEPDLAGYHVDRTDENGDTVRLTSAPLTTASYVDAGLDDAIWRYTVVAVDETGNESDPSPEREARVYTPELEQPWTPTPAAATGLQGSGIGAAEVLVEVARGSGTAALPSGTADADGRFTLAALPLEQGDNVFTIRLRDAAGNRSKPASVRVTADAPPSAPTGLAATQPSTYQVDLTWNPNPEADVIGYRPFRDGEPLLAEAPVTDAGATGSTDDPTRAVDGDPESFWWAGAWELPAWIEVSWPEPRIVTEVGLSWDSYAVPSDYLLEAWDGRIWVPVARVRDNTQPENLLRLSRPYRTDRLHLTVLANVDWTGVAELAVRVEPSVATLAWTDTAADGRHPYTITALDRSGFESAPSAPVEVAVGDVTPPDPVTLTGSVSGSDAHLQWTASADAVRYDLYRDGARVATIAAPGLSHVDAALLNGTYRYTVSPVDAAGNVGEPSNEVALTIAAAPPPAPTGLTVTPVPTGRALDLAWTPGQGAAASAWRILRSSVAGGPYTAVATVPAAVTTHRDSGLTNGQTYWYVVAALDAAGNASAFSNEASGTPADTAAPAAPLLHHPGFPGLPFSTSEAAVTVAGLAEPGSQVTLWRGLNAVAQATAVAADTTQEVVVEAEQWPRPSPDGRFLWLGSSFYDFATGTNTPAPAVDGEVRWLADAGGVVFTDGSAIRSYRLAGGEVRDLAETDFALAAVPSPDGRRLAVAGTHDGADGLWRLDLESGDWTLLLAGDPFAMFTDSLSWSPQGSSLALVRSGELLVLDADAGTGAPVTVETEPGSSVPDWSPDGTQLLFTSVADGSEQIWRFRPADGFREQVTTEPVEHRDPQWSPDGTAVAWTLDYNGVFVQPLAGGAPRQVGDAEGRSLAWLGGHLVLASYFEQQRITPAGHVEFRDTALHDGDNRFTAAARDAAGNTGARSAEMAVVREAGDRPDLAIAATDLTLLPEVVVSGATARATAVVRNLGSAASPASVATFVVVRPDGPPTVVAGSVAVGPIAPGASRAVTADFSLTGDTGRYTLVAAVDPSGTVAESSETNNSAERPFTLLEDAAPALFAATDQPVYAVGEEVRISLDAVNGGLAFTGHLEIAIEDAGGFLVEELADVAVTGLASGATLHRETVWTPVDVLAGAYRVHARLVDSQGATVAEATAAFSLGASAQVTAELSADRATYVIGATARLTGVVTYRAGNEALTGVTALLQVLPEAGGPAVATFTRTLGDLLPGAGGSVTADWSTTGAAAGPYRGRIEVRQGERLLATAETRFDLAAQAPRVTGTLTLSSRTPAWGSPVTANLAVRLTGGTALSQVPVRVVVLDPVLNQVLATQAFQLDLPASGAAVQRTASFDTRVLGLGGRLAVLEADLPGQTVTLDVESLTVLDLTPPTVTIDQPQANAVTDEDVEVLVTARDGLSPLGPVDVSLDGGAWLRMTVRDAAEGRFARSFAGLAVGQHRVKARAADAWGNLAETAEITFTVQANADPALAATKTDALAVDGDADNNGSPSPGDTIEYSITVRNTGNGPATDVVVVDPVPAHTTMVAGSVASTTGTVESQDPPRVAVGQLAAGAEATIRFRVRVDSPVPFGVTEVSNRATVTSNELPAVLSDDPDAGGDADPTVTPIAAAPRLVAEKTDALAVDADVDGFPSPGDTLEYKIALRNTGNTPATGILVLDAVPAHTSIVAGSVATTLGTVEAESPLRVSIAELDAGGEATVTFRALVDATVPAGVLEVSNQASVTSNELPALLSDDPDAGGAADATVTAITAAPRLVAEKTDLLAVDADGDGAPSPGDTLEYSVTLRNLGNTGATGVTFTDPIPARTDLVAGSVLASAGTVESESPVEVSVGTLAAGATVSVSFRVTVDNPIPGTVRTIVNQGNLAGDGLQAVLTDDPELPGAADPTATAITAAPRLAATKTDVLHEDADGDGAASPGDALLYQIAVTNTGNTTAAGVLLDDPIPAHTTVLLDSVQASQGTVLNESPVVVDLGDLPAGATANVSFRVRIDPEIPSDVVAVSNQATVTNVELPLVASDDPETAQPGDATVTPIVITPAVSIGGATVDEAAGAGAGAAVLAVTLSIPSNQPILVHWATADGTATGGLDYTPVAAGTLTFAPGETAKTVTVAILDDTLDEDDETFTVTLSGNVGVGGAADLEVAEGLVTIRDDDDPPALAVGDRQVLEASGSAQVPVQLSTATSRDVRVSWATAAGTGQPGADYVEASGTVIIPAGSLVGTIPVTILDDLLDEDDETFRIVLSAPVAATVLDGEATVTITDDDPLPSLSVADVTVNEGTGAPASVVFTVILSPASGRAVAVSASTVAGTAQAVTDFVPVPPTPLTFPAGTTSLTVTVPVVGDSLSESNETFSLALSQPQNATLADAEGTATIVDDDNAPVLSITGTEVQEGDSGTVAAELTITLSSTSSSAVTVQYATEDGTATAGEDYVPVTAATATIPAGSLSTTVTVQVKGDEESEEDETFFVLLSAPANATLGNDEGTVTILDDDLPRISVRDRRVTEGNAGTANVLVTVELDAPSTGQVRVDYATENGTGAAPAVAGRDYQAVSGTLTFSPGQTTKTISVPVIGDVLLEALEETFDVVLSHPAGGEIERGRATVVIEDDEACASPNLLSNPGAEEPPAGSDPIPGWAEVLGTGWQRKTSNPAPAEGAAYFFAGNVQNAELTQDVNVAAYAAHLLTGGLEFELQASVRTFSESPSDTARVVLELRNPANTVVLDAWDSGEIASPGQWQRLTHRRTAPAGTGWLRVRLISTRFKGTANDGYFDAVSLRSLRAATVSIGDVLVYEGAVGTTTNAVFPLTLSCPVESAASVRWATANGTALAGADYIASQGVATFPAGEVSRTVTVPVLGDEEHELHESFTVNLTEPAPAAPPTGIVLADPRGTGAIVNDDFCPRSPGFWKNHTEVWPASSLGIGNVQYSAAQLLTMLKYGGPNTSSHLARQLVATRFNLLVGSPPFIVPTVNEADLFLAAYPPGSNPPNAEKQRGEGLKNLLDAYNNMGCQEDPVIP